MEQLSLNLSEPTPENVYDTILKIVTDAAFHSDILSLKKLNTTGDYNVVVEAKPMCKICIKAKSKYIQVRYRLLEAIKAAGIPYNVKNADSLIQINFETLDDVLSTKQIFLEAFEIAYLENTDQTFGCCHRFKECSDARKCTHPNHLFALGCMYRKNLEAGRIFYGANPTV